MFSRLFKRKSVEETPRASGIVIFLLQEHLERFTTEQLNTAMQTAWHRPHEPTTFFATSLGDEGAVIKFGAALYPIVYSDQPLQSDDLGEFELPSWADHRATTRFSMEFPGGIADDSLSMFYGVAGFLVAQLVSSSTRALFFQESGVFVPTSLTVMERLRSPGGFLPAELGDLR